MYYTAVIYGVQGRRSLVVVVVVISQEEQQAGAGSRRGTAVSTSGTDFPTENENYLYIFVVHGRLKIVLPPAHAACGSLSLNSRQQHVVV